MADLSAKAQEREIDGVAYRVWPVSFAVGRPALVRLITILSPILSSLFKATSREGMTAAVFEALPGAMSDADLAYFGKVFGDAAQYRREDGEWAPLVEKVQGDHFAARYLAFFQWIVFAIEVNYSSFFDGIKNGAGADALLRTVTSK